VRVNDLTATDALRDGTLEPVLLDWVGQHSPPLNVLIRKSVSRQPRVRALIDFMAEIARHKAGARLPAGLPPVATAQKPEWFRRRVG
jgi:DNA-binding transcriptional LysR family regulator